MKNQTKAYSKTEQMFRYLRGLICAMVRFVLFIVCVSFTIPIFYAVDYGKLSNVITKYGITILTYLSFFFAIGCLYFHSTDGLIVFFICVCIKLVETPKLFARKFKN